MELTSNLKIGDKGPEVLLLQRTLNLLGYGVATSGPQSLGQEDSSFDVQTEQALLHYQNKYRTSGVTPTGTLDNTTLILLNNNISRLVSDAQSVANAPAVEQKTVEQKPQTPSAVKREATFVGLIVDGIFGPILNWFK